MRKLWRRIYYLLNRRRLERELAEEMEAHRELMTSDRQPYFGNTTQLREQSREAWSWVWLEQLGQDLSYGARVLMHAPGFTLGAVAVLALGIGVNLAEFQIFDALVLHRLHFRDADAFLQFSHVSRQGARLGFPAAAVQFYRSHNHTFAWLVAEEYSDMIVDGRPGVRSDLVSEDYFNNLRILPAWGRFFDERDTPPGATPTAVLSYSYWQTHWGSDPHFLGRFLHVNGQLVQVVGVAPYDFDGLSPRRTDMWLPLSARPLLLSGSARLQQDFSRATEALFGKIRPGVSKGAAESELTALTHELAQRQRAFRAGERIAGEYVQEAMSKRFARSPAVAIFVVLLMLVLLSACANLANMLLARGLARQSEIRIRTAIGASHARVVRQLMTENLLLAIAGAIAALVFSASAARLLLAALGSPVNLRLSMSWTAAVVSLALTLLSAMLFGLPSALRAVRGGAQRARPRRTLVGVQVTVSCLLLIASGVLVRNGIASASVDLAFDYRDMVVIDPQFYLRILPAGAAQQVLDGLAARLGEVPGVQGVTAAVAPPLGGRVMFDSLPGVPRIYRNVVAPSYFAVMNLPIVRGRPFVAEDRNAAIVSESAARSIWPNQDPVGRTLNLAGLERTVVGVVKDSGANLLADADSIEAYVPMQGADVERSALILHARSDPAPLLAAIVSATAELKEAVTVTLMRTSRDNFLEGQRRLMTLIGSIGSVATALASTGMFALVAFAVAQRRRELGIRMALGAAPRQIITALLAQNYKPLAAGIVAGTVLAAILSRVVRSIVSLGSPHAVDPYGFALGIAAFALVAALATVSPAMRALKIDPSATLRQE